jgi:hypothetical protein
LNSFILSLVILLANFFSFIKIETTDPIVIAITTIENYADIPTTFNPVNLMS